MEHATLIVSRTSEDDIKIRGIEILVDGEFVGDLRFGDSLQIEIPPGHHKIKATNRLKSKTLEFGVIPGETIRFEAVGIMLGGAWWVIHMMGTVAYRVTLKRVLN
jgi:hypothetical protein